MASVQNQSKAGQEGVVSRRWADKKSYALITPSYYVDFERCRLLVESAERFLSPRVAHYIIVDRLDENLFARLASERTHIILKQDILPPWLMQMPFARRYWLSTKSLPVRGWIVQQLVKLGVNLAIPADVFVFADSAVFFVRPFDPEARSADGKEPLFREPLKPIAPDIRSPLHEWVYRLGGAVRKSDWQVNAAAILGIPDGPGTNASYVDSLVTWRKDTLQKLQEHIEKVQGRSFMEVLCREMFLSEYVLYGVFCERVLGIENAGHYADSRLMVRSHWDEAELSEPDLIQMRDTLEPGRVAVMINEKSKVPAGLIRKVFMAPAGAGS